MTKDWYRDNGYQISINVDQAAIDLAERKVMEGYVLPILPGANPDADEQVAHCVADLAYLLLMQRSLSVTRSGAKEKTSTNSSSPDGWRILEELALTANMAIKTLRRMDGAVEDAKVTDVCKIKFTTNFIHT